MVKHKEDPTEGLVWVSLLTSLVLPAPHLIFLSLDVVIDL